MIFSYGNGVPMSLRAARTIEAKHGWKVRVVDLRWLVPLNEAFIAEQAKSAKRILVVDEGRHSAGVGEGVITAIAEAGFGGRLSSAWSAWIPTRRWPARRCWCSRGTTISSLRPIGCPEQHPGYNIAVLFDVLLTPGGG